MIAKYFIFVIFIHLIEPSIQQQNICGTNITITRHADPSSCHLFIHCIYDANRNLLRILPGSCYRDDERTPYFVRGHEFSFTCSSSNEHCANPLFLCPPSNKPDIMIADPYDRECRRHRLCRALDAPYNSCRAPLVFNRNLGICDFEENAPCERPTLPPRCDPGSTGFFPGNTCYRYFYCSNGELLFNFECSPGMYFDEAARSCLYDTNNICRRDSAETKTMEDDVKVYYDENILGD